MTWLVFIDLENVYDTVQSDEVWRNVCVCVCVCISVRGEGKRDGGRVVLEKHVRIVMDMHERECMKIRTRFGMTERLLVTVVIC